MTKKFEPLKGKRVGIEFIIKNKDMLGFVKEIKHKVVYIKNARLFKDKDVKSAVLGFMLDIHRLVFNNLMQQKDVSQLNEVIQLIKKWFPDVIENEQE